MTTNQTPDVDPVTDPGEPTPGGASQQVNQQVNWENRYNGLQRTFDKLQKKFADLQAEHDTAVAEAEELRQKIKGFDATNTATQNNLLQLETEKKSLEKANSELKFSKDRMKLILAEYPELAPFETDGLIPPADSIETLKPVLETFKARLNGMVTQNIQQKYQGVTPSGGPKNDGNPAHTREWLYARLNQLAGHRTDAQQVEYDQLKREWEDLTDKD